MQLQLAFEKSAKYRALVTGAAKRWYEENRPLDAPYFFDIEAVYPYFLIDLSMALETGGTAPFAIMAKGIVYGKQAQKLLGHKIDVEWGIRPDEFRHLCGKFIDDEEENFGYSRKYVTYEYAADPNYCIEFLFHRHDGWGHPGGTVELWITLLHKNLVD